MSLHTSLFVLGLLCFVNCWNSSLADDQPNVSIARLATDLLVTEQSTNVIKEWALDWQSDSEELRSSLMFIGPSFDAKKLFEDILVDDGHDEESDDGDMWATRDPTGRCGCCASMKALNYNPFMTQRQSLVNGLIQTVCDRLVVDIKKSRLDPMPLLLRRRSVKETAFLFQSRLPFQRSLSYETLRDDRSHHDESTVDETPIVPNRVMASLEGLSTLSRVGDVQTTILPNGRTLLKVNLRADSFNLTIPSTDDSSTKLSPSLVSEANLFQSKTSAQKVVINEVLAEMNLFLHPRQGLLLHSFQFAKPTEIQISSDSKSDQSTTSDSTRIPFRASGVPLVDYGNEAAIAQQVRRCIRRTLRSS